MTYVPVENLADFESRVRLADDVEDPSAEDQHLEFKDRVVLRPENQREFARDVTQFMNSDGGVLVVGVHEVHDSRSNRRVAKAIVPVHDVDATVGWMATALSNYSYPAVRGPTIFTINPWGRGQVIVVNVEPTSELTAVWRHSEAKNGTEYLYRANAQKAWFNPDEVARRMQLEQNRVMRLTIEQILSTVCITGSRKREAVLTPVIHVKDLTRGRMHAPNTWASVGELGENEFRLNVHVGTSLQTYFHIPYFYVRGAWTETRGHLALDLRVEIYATAGRWFMNRP